jgi:ribosomal protein L35
MAFDLDLKDMVAASLKHGLDKKSSKIKRSLDAQVFKHNVDNEIQ